MRRSRLPLLPLLPLLALLATACAHGRPTGVRPADAAPSRPASPRRPPPATERDVHDLRARELLVPVAGVAPDRVPDTFTARRGDRLHHAVDILAPRGTPVLSADDGRVLRLSSNALGGITVYATDPAERFVYYYAHLDRYHERLADGMRLARGDTIGFVGTTGNAPPDTPHLHFQVMLWHPGGRYWEGTPLDPRPHLTTVTTGTLATTDRAEADREADMTMTSKRRAELRAEAHHLQPMVHVGQHGVTPALIQSLDEALRTRELVKVQLGRQAELSAREAADALAAALLADVVQVIGKTATLYRPNPELARKPGDPPPWRR